MIWANGKRVHLVWYRGVGCSIRVGVVSKCLPFKNQCKQQSQRLRKKLSHGLRCDFEGFESEKRRFCGCMKRLVYIDELTDKNTVKMVQWCLGILKYIIHISRMGQLHAHRFAKQGWVKNFSSYWLPSLTDCLQPHTLRHNVASLAIFYCYFHANRSSELASCMPLSPTASSYMIFYSLSSLFCPPTLCKS